MYFNAVRDCYEAFVIYNFLSLCYEYLGKHRFYPVLSDPVHLGRDPKPDLTCQDERFWILIRLRLNVINQKIFFQLLVKRINDSLLQKEFISYEWIVFFLEYCWKWFLLIKNRLSTSDPDLLVKVPTSAKKRSGSDRIWIPKIACHNSQPIDHDQRSTFKTMLPKI